MTDKPIQVIGFISKSDYAEFCRVCVDTPNPAPNYESWLQRINNGLENMRTQGIFPVQVRIDPNEMARWCALNGMQVDSRGRAAYAAALYAKQSGSCESHKSPQA